MHDWSPQRRHLFAARAGHLVTWAALGVVAGWAFVLGDSGSEPPFAALALTLPAALLVVALCYSWADMNAEPEDLTVFGETKRP